MKQVRGFGGPTLDGCKFSPDMDLQKGSEADISVLDHDLDPRVPGSQQSQLRRDGRHGSRDLFHVKQSMPLARRARFAADDPEDLLPRPGDPQRLGKGQSRPGGPPGQEIIDPHLAAGKERSAICRDLTDADPHRICASSELRCNWIAAP